MASSGAGGGGGGAAEVYTREEIERLLAAFHADDLHTISEIFEHATSDRPREVWRMLFAALDDPYGAGKIEIAELLIEHPAIEEEYEHNVWRQRVLVAAAVSGEHEILERLLERCSPFSAAEVGAAIAAVENGYMVERLLQVASDLPRRDLSACLEVMARHGDLTAVQRLMHAGADVDFNHQVAVYSAHENGHQEVVDYLVGHGADLAAAIAFWTPDEDDLISHELPTSKVILVKTGDGVRRLLASKLLLPAMSLSRGSPSKAQVEEFKDDKVCAFCMSDKLDVKLRAPGEPEPEVATKGLLSEYQVSTRASLHRTFLLTPCGHTFHRACLERWVLTSTTCPTCRTVIVGEVADESPLACICATPWTPFDTCYAEVSNLTPAEVARTLACPNTPRTAAYFLHEVDAYLPRALAGDFTMLDEMLSGRLTSAIKEEAKRIFLEEHPVVPAAAVGGGGAAAAAAPEVLPEVAEVPAAAAAAPKAEAAYNLK